MNAFIELRKRAREKRDKAIAQAREDYAATLRRIANLEQDLCGRDPSTHKTLSSCIESVIPSDRVFTTLDVMTSLEALDPKRDWRVRTIHGHLSRLRARGIVRRVKRAQKTQPAVYVRVGANVEPLPFEDMTLAEVVEEVLKSRQPMRQTDLVVAMLEAEYQTTMKPKALRNAVGRVLRGDEGRFGEKGGKWVAS